MAAPASASRRALLVLSAAAPLAVVVHALPWKKNNDEPERRWPTIDVLQQDVLDFLTTRTVATALIACFSVLLLVPASKRASYLGQFMKEFLGSILMVVFTFSPGPFLGYLKGYEEWAAHLVGVIVADYVCGSPQVNPAVTIAMFVWRKLSLLQVLVNISAQMAGGIVAFPLLQSIARPYKAVIGGPSIKEGVGLTDAFISEGVASFALLLGIFAIATTYIGKVYPVKQPLVAAVIRLLIVFFGKTGPAMNPMLGTCWAFYSAGLVFPTSSVHFIVYWLAPAIGASAATFLWSAVTLTGPYEDEEAYNPKSVDEAWNNHFAAFGAQDVDRILLDYCNTSKVSVHDLNDDKRVEYEGKDGVRDLFEGLFGELSGINPAQDISGKADVQSGKYVFLTWRCPKKGIRHATDTFVFNDDYKIVQQNIVVLRG